MAQRAIRFSESTDKGIREATEKRGFSSPTAFIRHAVEQALSGHKEELASSEQRLAASMEQVRQELLAHWGERNKPCSRWWTAWPRFC